MSITAEATEQRQPPAAGPASRSRVAPGLLVMIVRDPAGLEALRPSWDMLVDQCATASPFQRFEWISLWWQECRRDFSLVVVVLTNECGEPKAIAPLMIGHGARGREHLRVLGFLGGLGPAQGERLDFIVPRGHESELTPALCTAFKMLRREWDAVHLAKVPAESPNLPHMLRALAECGDDSGILNRHACHVVKLPESWEAFEDSRSAPWRSKFRRRWKAMVNEHETVIGLGGGDIPVQQAMRDLHDLHELNWPGGQSLFTQPEAWRFHERLALHGVPRGRVVLLTITIDGKAAAVVMGLIERDEFFQFQHGWDPAFSKISLGRLAMHAFIQYAIRRGLRTYDMLPGEFEYKAQLGNAVRHVLDIEAFNPLSLRAHLFRSLRGVKRLVPDHKPDSQAHSAGG